MFKVLRQKSVQTWSRRLHIYSSMVLLIAMVFFAITGLTLNRPELFVGKPNIDEFIIDIPKTLLGAENQTFQPKKDNLVNFLKTEGNLKGIPSPLNIYTVIEDGELVEGEVEVDFKGPGYDASVFIDMNISEAEIRITNHGTIAWLNDLHKGRNTGAIWHIFIDVVSIVMVLFILTGAILLLPKKKTFATAIKWMGAGTAITISCYYLSFI
ncbi:peptidase [Photobacterium sanctipauli]|uniref:Peptidase n=1 Tax=Photobacterium sanctipauli TaxID=1342794 RepID=A0A2T3NNY6_9GAMM|nr:PepSY-associated TM helix domain-containing protein [Photobacterium sanctipauli]PSW17692.1 peptidase [Photobacterium sanctipauli]